MITAASKPAAGNDPAHGSDKVRPIVASKAVTPFTHETARMSTGAACTTGAAMSRPLTSANPNTAHAVSTKSTDVNPAKTEPCDTVSTPAIAGLRKVRERTDDGSVPPAKDSNYPSHQPAVQALTSSSSSLSPSPTLSPHIQSVPCPSEERLSGVVPL
eukprot:2430134-Pleurochrysis_carterae.AAC.1